MKLAGIILCGGKSSRMGRPKATLPFGPETMLRRIERLLGEAASPLIVVAARGQALAVSGGTLVAYDVREDRGPLEGMLAGLRALPCDVDAAFVTTCDAPLLVPAVVARLARLLHDAPGRPLAAVVEIDGAWQPLSAVFRVAALPAVERAVAADQMSPRRLLAEWPLRVVHSDELRDLDPALATFRNVNTPDEYRAALATAGFAAPT